MRLAVVTPNFPPARGGVQTYSFHVASELAKLSHDVTVVTPRPHTPPEPREGLVDIMYTFNFRDNLAVSALPALIKHLRRGTTHAILATHWSAGFSALQAKRLLSAQLPIFVTAHGKEVLLKPLEKCGPAQAVYDRIRRYVYHNADLLLPVSHFTAELLARSGFDEKPHAVIPNGVDASHYQPVDGQPLREKLCPDGQRLLLTVSRLVRRKGIDTVIASLARVNEEAGPTNYVVVGEGPDRQRLERLVSEARLKDRVRFWGEASDDELPAFYSACDAFVMPARSEPPDVEGFGLVFLEAGACGKPVIGSTAGGIPDAILEDRTGKLVPPGDADALAQAAIQLLSEPGLARRLGREGQRYASKEATWAQVAKRLVQVIEEHI